MNKNVQAILTKISTVTLDINENYPELQKYLKETRSTLPNGSNQSAELKEKDLQNYLDQLTEMVDKYKEEH